MDTLHPTFEEQHTAGQDPKPCVCWSAGRRGLGRADLYPHPQEWRAGVRSAVEYERDI